MENQTVSIKIQGQRENVELVIQHLKTIYKVSIVGPLRQNDQDNGVHVFVNVDPRLTSKAVKA